MADPEVQNYTEIIVSDEGPQSMTNILDSNDYKISETIHNYVEPLSDTTILDSNNYVISETIYNYEVPQSDTNIFNSNSHGISETISSDERSQNELNIQNYKSYDISETILNDEKPQSETNNSNSNNYVISEIILNDERSQSDNDILNSNSYIISETILKDDGPQNEANNFNSNIFESILNDERPQSETNILNSINYVTSENISNDDEPEMTKTVLNSIDNITCETIINSDESKNMTKVLNLNSYTMDETILNDERPQSETNILNSNNYVISENISNDDEPEMTKTVLNSIDNIINETIINSDESKNMTKVLNLNSYTIDETILNDKRPQSEINILSSNKYVISETISNDGESEIIKTVLNSIDNITNETIINSDESNNMTKILNSSSLSSSETILNDDRPQSVSNNLNSNDKIISGIVSYDDRSHVVSNNLNTSDEVISKVILNDDRLQADINILNFNGDDTTIEISTSDSLNIIEGTSISPSNFKKDSFNDIKVNLPVTETDQSLISGHCKEYVIGDIVWAKIGKYPFWPSIVCSDPVSNTYYRKKKRIYFHVRFCNDKGRRSWTRTIENYCGKNELLSKYPNCLTYIKNSEKLMETWNLAVKEADNLLKLDGEERMIEFMKTFSNLDDLDSVNSSASNNHSEDTIATAKVRTYSRKRSLTVLEQDSKINKTENISVEDSTSSRSIDIPLLSRSDDADSTVSDISMNHVYMEDLKTKEEIIKKRKSTKTYPPKSSFTHKYDLPDSMKISPEYNGNNILLSDNHNSFADKSVISTRSIPEHKKLEISLLEGDYEQDNITSISPCSSKKIHPLKSSNSKKAESKRKRFKKEFSTGRKSTTAKNESSPEPDTTESEASSKNETYSSVFLASTKNKQLFVKILKRACVVCKNYENTVKCTGPCQSYFHEECSTISEDRYRKSEIKIPIKNKKYGRRSKRHYSKCANKKKSIANLQQVISNTNEENIDKLYEKDDTTSKSINCLNSVVINQSSDCNDENKSLENTMSDSVSDSTKGENCVFMPKDNTPIELEIVNKKPISKIPNENIINTPMKSAMNDTITKDETKFMCSLCKAEKTYCFACGLNIEDLGQKIMCKMSSCGKYYHEKCLKDWPQCQWIQGLRNNVRCVVCPHHVCHLCISDNPKSSCKTHFPGEKLCRCIKCPTAYHRSEYCLPAGSKVLTYFDIICSRHFEPSQIKNYHYNAPWCFICTLGGTLICCDLCPSSFHIECLNQNPSEFEEGFTCEECQTGRYPLYGEIVWVKIGQYRWWPAQIVFPNQVPDSVNTIAHSVGQFAVRFFGTYDYYWVNRGRVFNFHEGDDENILKKNRVKVIDQVFQDAIVEAAQAHNAYIIDKDKNDAIVAKKSLTKPPKFIRIKFNKPIGNVKNMEFDSTTMTPCECDPTKPNPCGPDSDCINRMLMFECQPELCPAGDKCNNQRFEKTLYPAMVPFLTKGRGWGLKTLEDIKEGSFIIEYVGDVIDEEEFQRRCLEMHQRNEQNYYFLTIDNSRMIDAGPKGNLSRFMNHSCEPNCVTQKWTVNGDTRIGLFALHDIPSGTELVFDYRLQSCSGVEKKPCQCGAARCSKFIGVKVEEEKKKLISTNDVDKCKPTSKNKRKPLKLKDNVSDSDKSKLSKVLKNDQNISMIENEVYVSNVEKMDDSKKSKIKLSLGKQSTILKNGNSDSSEKSAIKRRWKNAKKNDTNITKDDNTTNFLESEESNKSKRKSLSTFSSRKQLLKKNVFKTSVLPVLPNNYTELSNVSTSCFSEKKDHVGVLKSIKDMKMTRISGYSSNDIKTEQLHKMLNNDHVNIPNGFTEIQERTRSSLSRLAKSRHSFLSKNNSNKEKNGHSVISKIKFNKEKKITTKIPKTKIKHREISSMKMSLMKKTKLNTQSLQSKTYYKNDSCLICGKGHAELSCKNKKCPRVFHLNCMNKTRVVKSGFICPSHFCSVCKKRKVVAKCKFCVESFCTTHVKGNIFKDPLGNGMLCTTHCSSKKPLPIASSSVTTCPSVNNQLSVTNTNVESESIDFAGPNLSTELIENSPHVDTNQLNLDEINEEEYNLTQVVKAECDREYIHIGGFNVCNMSDLVSDQEERYTIPVDTDGDLFKPSSANVVIDIESASALYQPSESLELESIAIESKDCNDYANVHFIPDVCQTKNKWLAAEP